MEACTLGEEERLSVPAPLFVHAPDDVGAETADRYDWQALTAAVDCLAWISVRSSKDSGPATDVRLICEHHEDYILCVGNGIELVSVKHRDLGQGAWTRATLFGAGGIAHLFRRWLILQESTSARLVTNAGLKSDVVPLRDLCSRLKSDPATELDMSQCEDLADAAKRIADATDPATVSELGWRESDGTPSIDFVACVRRFLAILIFDCERPHRGLLPSAAVSMYVVPFLRAIGGDPTSAESAWTAIANLFRQRMRGHIAPDIEGLETVIRNIHGLTNEERLSLRLNDRLISAEDILEAVDVAQTLGLSLVNADVRVAPTRLALKLINAGCQVTTVHAAEAAAQRWRNHESALVQASVGIPPALERIKTHTLVIASGIQESEAEVATGNDYGTRMWRRLRESLRAEEVVDEMVTMDDDLALGLACDLASQCLIWFSPAFDMQEARTAFPARLEGSPLPEGGRGDSD